MKRNDSLISALFALCALLAGFFAWRWHGELNAMRVAAAEAKADRADLQESLRKAKAQISQLQGDRVNPVARAPETAAPQEAPAAPARGNAAQNLLAVVGQLSASPQVAAMQRYNLRLQYAAFAARMNLSPEQSEKLMDALASQQISMAEGLGAMQAAGMQNPQDMRQFMAGIQESSTAAIREVVGDEGFAALQEYNQTMPQRNTVSQLQRDLTMAGVPMNAAQSEQMVQLLSANPQGGGAQGGAPAQISPAALQQASTVLSPAQLAIINESQQASQGQRQVQQTLQSVIGGGQNAVRGGGGGGGGVGRGGARAGRGGGGQ